VLHFQADQFLELNMFYIVGSYIPFIQMQGCSFLLFLGGFKWSPFQLGWFKKTICWYQMILKSACTYIYIHINFVGWQHIYIERERVCWVTIHVSDMQTGYLRGLTRSKTSAKKHLDQVPFSNILLKEIGNYWDSYETLRTRILRGCLSSTNRCRISQPSTVLGGRCSLK